MKLSRVVPEDGGCAAHWVEDDGTPAGRSFWPRELYLALFSDEDRRRIDGQLGESLCDRCAMICTAEPVGSWCTALPAEQRGAFPRLVPAPSPPRRTAGAGWTWTHPATGLLVREMREDEYQQIRRGLATAWGGENHPRLEMVRRLCDEYFNIHGATMLLATRHEALVRVFSLRPRGQDVANIALLTRVGDDLADPAANVVARLVPRGVCEWAYRVGYKRLTTLLLLNQWDRAAMRRSAQHTRARIVARHDWLQTPLVEIVRDLEAIVREPVSAWEAWRPQPELPLAAELPSQRVLPARSEDIS